MSRYWGKAKGETGEGMVCGARRLQTVAESKHFCIEVEFSRTKKGHDTAVIYLSPHHGAEERLPVARFSKYSALKMMKKAKII